MKASMRGFPFILTVLVPVGGTLWYLSHDALNTFPMLRIPLFSTPGVWLTLPGASIMARASSFVFTIQFLRL